MSESYYIIFNCEYTDNFVKQIIEDDEDKDFIDQINQKYSFQELIGFTGSSPIYTLYNDDHWPIISSLNEVLRKYKVNENENIIFVAETIHLSKLFKIIKDWDFCNISDKQSMENIIGIDDSHKILYIKLEAESG